MNGPRTCKINIRVNQTQTHSNCEKNKRIIAQNESVRIYSVYEMVSQNEYSSRARAVSNHCRRQYITLVITNSMHTATLLVLEVQCVLGTHVQTTPRRLISDSIDVTHRCCSHPEGASRHKSTSPTRSSTWPPYLLLFNGDGDAGDGVVDAVGTV